MNVGIKHLLVMRPDDATHVDIEGFFIKIKNGHIFEKSISEDSWRSIGCDDLSLTRSLEDFEFMVESESLLHRVNDLINSDSLKLLGKSMNGHPLHKSIKEYLEKYFHYSESI